MTDTFAPSARPTNTAIAWASKDGIYVEIPCKDGPPYIARYHKTAEGLASALNILLERSEAKPRAAAPAHPKITFGPKSKIVATEDQREGVRAVLKKAGII